jgi:hypothetical protein
MAERLVASERCASNGFKTRCCYEIAHPWIDGKEEGGRRRWCASDDSPRISGVIVANADFIGGFALWVDDKGLLTHTHSFLGVETYKETASSPLPPGEVTVRMQFDATEPKPGTGSHVTLFINDEPVGGGDMPHTVPIAFTSYSGMDIGRDNGLVVDLAYEDKAPYPFTGTAKKVIFDLKPRHPMTTASRRWLPHTATLTRSTVSPTKVVSWPLSRIFSETA